MKSLMQWIHMVKEQLKKKFMRVAIRTAITVLLPLSLIVPALVYAAGEVKPAPVVQAIAPAGKTEAPAFVEIDFQEIGDIVGFVKTFPFLQTQLNDVIKDNADNTIGAYGVTNVYVANLHRKEQKDAPHLFLLMMDGSVQCGTRGCSLTIYRHDGKGFVNILDAMTGDGAQLYISPDNRKLLTCSVDGRVEWNFSSEKNTFVSAGIFKGSEKNMRPCTSD